MSARKLPARYAAFVMPLFLSILMSGVVSFISTGNSDGFTGDFLSTWLRGWGVSWLIAFPTLLLILPLVRRATAAVVRMG